MLYLFLFLFFSFFFFELSYLVHVYNSYLHIYIHIHIHIHNAQDVSGFTPMTEQLGKRGAEGAELVRDILSSYLSRLLEVVDDYQGDVIKVLSGFFCHARVLD